MADRRSVRSRKEIDYSKFGRTGEDSPFMDDDDDDDFAEPTPPPSKRVKKETKKKSEKKLSSKSNAKTSRLSVNEKVFDRELQLAMEMSAAEASQPPTVLISPPPPQRLMAEQSSPPPGLTSERYPSPPGLTSERSPPHQRQDFESPPHLVKYEEKENQSSNVAHDDAAHIDIIEEDVGEAVKARRRAPPKKYNLDESDEDSSASEDEFKPQQQGTSDISDDEDDADISEDEDDDFCPEEDDDFSTKSKPKKAPQPKKKVSPKVQPVAKKSPVSLKPTLTVLSSNVTKKANLSGGQSLGAVKPSAHTSSNPGVKSTYTTGPKPSSIHTVASVGVKSSPSIGIKRKWNPPSVSANSGSSLCSMKSPSAGLRLGLSRKSRIKPLHANVKVPQ